MPTRVLVKPRKLTRREQLDLQPNRRLWTLCPPEKAEFAFRARTPAAARAWQKPARKALADILGFQDWPRVPARPRLLERVDKGDYLREKWLIRTSPQSVLPFYLLLPKRAARPLPAVLAFHGHGYGVKDIVGLWDDGRERDTPDGYHKDFAVTLCRLGFAVAAPEIACFGERQNDYAYLQRTFGAPGVTSCHNSSTLAFHAGGSVLGIRIFEARRLVDHLAARKDLDLSRLGAMGISGGGMHTLYSAALDTRIRAAVISGYASLFRDSIFGMHHCTCNFAPGLARFGEFPDIAALLAPRPVLFECGNMDPIFPIFSARAAVKRIRAIYGVSGAADRVDADFFEGRHQISGVKAWPFLLRECGPAKPAAPAPRRRRA